MSKKALRFDEVVEALESAGHIILLCPYGDELVCTGRFFEENEYRLTADGVDDIIIESDMTCDVSDDGHGFYVPGYRLGVFPQKSFDFKA